MQIRDILKKYNDKQCKQLDMELLLAHVLQVTRSYLYLHVAEEVQDEKYDLLQNLVNRYLTGEPLAYILGNCEFWDLQLAVNHEVLIPRPETELLVELALQKLNNQQPLMIADLGTGSGAVALALARERSHWHICATDNSGSALRLAKRNSQELNLPNITFSYGDWCDALPKRKFAAIVSNPPYIAVDDIYVQESVKKFEPKAAVFAEENGLAAIRKIIKQAPSMLLKQGQLMLEHGFNQRKEVQELMVNGGFNEVETYQDLSGHDRVTLGIYDR